ncbi:MAG TPA: hypothetical protein VFE48_25265 [Methylomirabilota bacterium]|nr:hypothetical protein [Methylomirabilota bacterium]
MSDDVRERLKRFIDDVMANPNRREAYETVCARWEDVRHRLEHVSEDEAEATEADLAYEATILRTVMGQFEFHALRESEDRLRSSPNN